MMAHADMYFWVVLDCHNVGRTMETHNWGVSKMNVKEPIWGSKWRSGKTSAWNAPGRGFEYCCSQKRKSAHWADP